MFLGSYYIVAIATLTALLLLLVCQVTNQDDEAEGSLQVSTSRFKTCQGISQARRDTYQEKDSEI